MNLLKSVLHNLGVTAVSFAFAFIGYGLDTLLGLAEFRSLATEILGALLLLAGFLLRVWATFDFYQRQMKVLSLVPQKQLISSGPYRFSRNPLYLGGNVFMFLGAVLAIGTPAGMFLTLVNIIAVDRMIRREEKQLERDFGQEWTRYRSQVRRWI